MAWPTDRKTTFLRDPRTTYRHDGFGHDNRQEPAGVKPCFRVGPHSGSDLTGRGPIFSIAGGIVAESRYTTRAGHALIEDVTIPGLSKVIGQDRIWPIYFHGASPFVAKGVTRPGQQVGTIGDTGTGTSKGAYHLHLSIATSLAAARSLIDSGTPTRRNGETVAQWGRRAGLVDPLLVLDYLDSLAKPATGGSETKPANPAVDPKEYPMHDFIAQTTDTKKTYLVVLNPDPGDRAARHIGSTDALSTLYAVDKTQGGTGKPYPITQHRLTLLSEELERLADERRK